MKTNRFGHGEQVEGSAAFTLTELVVVIAVVAVLITLQLPVLARAGRQAVVAQCAENLRQFSAATLIYAHDFRDRFPDSPGGNWAWDLPWAVGDLLNRYGAPWKVMYCPGTAPRFDDTANLQLYTYASNNYRVIGYAQTFPGSLTLNPTNQNFTIYPPLVNVGFGVFTRQLVGERVLLADATISGSGEANESLRANYNYTSIIGGYPLPHTSPHLSGKIPLGGNVGMLDGRVEWRPFADMHPRTTGSATFWW